MKSNKRSNGILRIAYALVAVVIIVIVVGFCMPKKKECIQGEVETTDYRVSSKVPARVAKLYVHEGDNVKKGDTLVVMEAPDIMAKLSEANAAHSAAEAIELEAQHGTRQEQIQSAYAMWEKAKAGLVVAEKTYQRVVHLYDEGVLPAQKRDEAQAQYDAMRATEQAARSQYEMAVNGARNEDKMAAAAQVSRAKGAVDEVSSYVNETILTASADGEVSEIFPEVGELVGTGAPIMNINVLDDVWFTFNIREDLLPGIQLDKRLKVYVPALDRRIPVKITLMKNIGNFAAWKATKALDRYDLKMFEVQAHPLTKTEGLLSGMSVVLLNDEK